MTTPASRLSDIGAELEELERLTTTIEKADPLDPGLPVLIRKAQDMEQRLLKAIHRELEVHVLAYARFLAISRDPADQKSIEDLKSRHPELKSKIEEEVRKLWFGGGNHDGTGLI
ncbi:hypothetical protein [Thermaurantiacus tibetensis]|uniref:hypothetical protein n=1 Tax=Thermaurantiacus tibetensis TaxID=2759035 RepID=UPI001890765E|nr:hypothetical protein [Thermaurantiacus tibetensis]